MSKIVVTESQLKSISKMVIKESEEHRFRQDVDVDFEYHGVTFNGEDIDWIAKSNITLTFRIDMEYRQYGIKSIMVYDIQGPSEIELTITPQVDDANDETITIPLNWHDDNFVQRESDDNVGWIGIEESVTIHLQNDELGRIKASAITINVNDI
jgi:hypothetical protein